MEEDPYTKKQEHWLVTGTSMTIDGAAISVQIILWEGNGKEQSRDRDLSINQNPVRDNSTSAKMVQSRPINLQSIKNCRGSKSIKCLLGITSRVYAACHMEKLSPVKTRKASIWIYIIHLLLFIHDIRGPSHPLRVSCFKQGLPSVHYPGAI